MNISKEIFEHFRQGQIDDFYAEAWPSLIAYASRLLGDYYAMMAEDCVQESIVATYNARHTFGTPLQMKSYVFTCLHNRCVSFLRKASHREQYVSECTPGAEKEIVACIIEQETYDLLYKAVEGLPEKYKQVFELNFEQGLTNIEAAAALDISLSMFNKRKQAMIACLREQFGGNEQMWAFVSMLLSI